MSACFTVPEDDVDAVLQLQDLRRSPSPPSPTSASGFSYRAYRGGLAPANGDGEEDFRNTAWEGQLAVASIANWPLVVGSKGSARNVLSRLSVEIDSLSQEWAAYRRGGHLSPEGALAAAADVPPPSLDPWRTARAASLLVQTLRQFEPHLTLRRMLEPLAQELLEAVYRDWNVSTGLLDTKADDVNVERFHGMPTHYALLRGHLEVTRDARDRCSKAEMEAETLRKHAAPREEALEALRRKVEELEAQLVQERELRKKADKTSKDWEEEYLTFKRQTKIALADYQDTQYREMIADSTIKQKQSEIYELQRQTRELNRASAELNAKIHHLEEELSAAKAAAEHGKWATEQLPATLARLEKLEAVEALAGIDFARRVAKEVLKCSVESLCNHRPSLATANLQRGADNRSRLHRTVVLDTVCRRLVRLPTEIETLHNWVKKLKNELEDTRRLIPVWNADALEDLHDAYNWDSPVHREVFHDKDTRAFAGLGAKADVPPFLRAQGLVRSIELSKSDLLSFILDFWGFLARDDRLTQGLSPKMLHLELNQFLRSRFKGDEATQFAYTLVGHLQVHRDEPDAELLDLLLSGVCHASILEDQQGLRRTLHSLLQACQDGPMEEVAGTRMADVKVSRGKSKDHSRGKSKDKHHFDKHVVHHQTHKPEEQVSRRIIRAALQVTFPEKTRERHNSVRRALHTTLQQIHDAGKSPAPDSACINDLFKATSQGFPTPLWQEIMRQHYCEVVEFSALLAKKLRVVPPQDKEPGGGDDEVFVQPEVERTHVNAQALRATLTALEPQHGSHIDRLVKVGCPDGSSKQVPVLEVHRRLRHALLLRPARLWVQAQPKDMVDLLLGMKENDPDEDVSSASGNNYGDGEDALRPTEHPRRHRGVKVLDNPGVQVNSEVYSTPEGLLHAIGADPGPAEPEAPAEGAAAPAAAPESERVATGLDGDSDKTDVQGPP